MSNLESFDAIFFDFDGTLVDSLSIMYVAYLEILQTYNIIGTKEEFNSLNGPSIPEIARYFKRKYQLKDTVDEILRIYLEIIDTKRGEIEAFPLATELLSFLSEHNKEIHLVTSNRREACEEFLQSSGWAPYFSEKTFGDDVLEAKPNPEIYEKACHKTSFPKSRVLVIEDSINGVLSSKGANLRTFAVRNGEEVHYPNNAADQVFNVLGDLMHYFQK